ncbi:TadE/TadG family type IV pilus assembly protein [Erythrobacter sp. MTPC3]|uniref:TadE/TadG family type IV pilus assembly protein n=1 Tax=Erythrobacter sp. MTPC3 TaxID=3056564 RepID=UPI0036F37B1E
MMKKATSPFGKLARKEDGVTIVEFALVAPVLLLMLVGLLDFGLQMYARAIVDGAMQDAGRDSSLEPGGPTAAQMDAQVTARINDLLPSANVTFTRRNYEDYGDVGAAEEFTDSNGDGICNDNEPFEDMNGNGIWDGDQGRDGRGGASDAVVYESQTSYGRLFPIDAFINVSPNVVIESTTILRNQPYSDQGERIAEAGSCDV